MLGGHIDRNIPGVEVTTGSLGHSLGIGAGLALSAKTDKKDTFIFIKPRVLSLFAERKASAYHHQYNDEELWDYFHKINATHLISSPMDGDNFNNFIDRYKDNFQEVYSNPDFNIYHILINK